MIIGTFLFRLPKFKPKPASSTNEVEPSRASGTFVRRHSIQGLQLPVLVARTKLPDVAVDVVREISNDEVDDCRRRRPGCPPSTLETPVNVDNGPGER